MTDLRRSALNNQKREPVVGVFPVLGSQVVTLAVAAVPATPATATAPAQPAVLALPAGAWVADLPPRVLVTNVQAVTKVVAANALANINVKVGLVNIATNMVVGPLGSRGIATSGYFPVGGQLTITSGTVAPSALADIEVLVSYVELDVLSGEYIS